MIEIKLMLWLGGTMWERRRRCWRREGIRIVSDKEIEGI